MPKTNDIWVLIHSDSPGDHRAGLELLTPGKVLADGLKTSLTAVVLGSATDGSAQSAIAMGADRALTAEDPRFAQYDTDPFFQALAFLIENHEPRALLIPATEQGRDLAPRLACRFQTGLTADCTQVGLESDGETIAWIRPALGGNLMATIVCPGGSPQMATIRPGVFSPPEPDPSRTGPILPVRELPPLSPSRVSLLSRLRNLPGDEALAAADIIVAGGLGMGSSENFQLIHRLAAALGGSVAASRAAVQEGWAPYACQVGQSGRTVRPRVYIACGISGAIQHLAGITGADCVIAINSDPNAPIFKAAAYGLLGDAPQILNRLLTILESNGKGGPAPGRE